MLGFSALLPRAQAQAVVLDTLSSSVFGQTSVNATTFRAQPFLTPSTGSYQLVSVSLGLGAASNSSGNFFVRLMQGDQATGPDSGLSIVNLSGSTNPASAGQYTFTASSLMLTANTTYWIVAGVSSGAGSYRWTAASNDTYQTSTWTPVDAFALSTNSGSSWTVTSGASANPYLFSVTATAIPEPSTYAALAGLGALGLALWRRRQKKSAV